MFGFSLPKIIFLFLIILFIWQIFKIIEKRNQLKKDQSNDENEDADYYEALIECKKCGNFYSNDENDNCPVCGAKNK